MCYQVLTCMEDVCNFFPTDAKQLYEEALKEGSVKLSIIKCLVLGIAGVGKTCLKRFLLKLPQNEDGPIGRVSTGLADNPIEVLVGSVDSILMGVDKKDKEKWEVLDEAKLIEVIVHSCGSNISSPAPNNVRESQSHDMPTSTTASEREYHPEPAIEEVNRQIINIFKSKKLYGKEFYVNLIHFIDSGGQPQFIELLPAFVQDLNAILYAVNLSESLDHHPTIYFYGQNCQPIGTPYQSPFSHGQVLQKCVRATYTTDVCPQVFVVGTHRDKQNECAEKREDKDRMIKKLVPTNCLVQRNEPQVLWDVNGIKPDLYDQDIANHLRRAIVHHCTNNELSASLPMKWFVLRMWITSFAEQGVLSLRRCLELAQKLSMDQSDLEAALLHMVDYNLFLWYPKIPELRDVVISDPQVILKIITHLVQCKHDLSALSNDAGIKGIWRSKFNNHAIVTREFLRHDHFKKHFIEGVFTVEHFIGMMCHLLIMVDLKNGDYQFPALLDPLGIKTICQGNQLVDTLLIRFPNEFVPHGFFIFLVAFLQTRCSLVKESMVPVCLYSDCVKLKDNATLTQFTIIDSVTYIKVHLEMEEDWSKVEDCSKACLQI